MEIYYIKLGEQGAYEKECINGGYLRLGFNSRQHQESLNGEWDKVWDYWDKEKKGKKGVATRYVNQIKAFYELPDTTYWMTFYQDKLWWCTAESDVKELPDGGRIRRTVNGWSCEDINGNLLLIDNLDGRITTTRGYQSTICSPRYGKMALDKIHGIIDPIISEAQHNFDQLKLSVSKLIKSLTWRDFEVLVDLIFSRAGWQRMSSVGDTRKGLDIAMMQPTTNRMAYAQVKSTTSQKEYDKYVEEYRGTEGYDDFFYIYHTTNNNKPILIDSDDAGNGFYVLSDQEVAEMVINGGLVQWLILKRM